MTSALAAGLSVLYAVGFPIQSQEPPEGEPPDGAPDVAGEAPVVATLEEEYAVEVDLAERLGSLLYTKVRLVEEATAAAALVVDRRTLGSAHRSVVVSQDGQWTVRFVGSAGDRLVSYYDVTFSAAGIPRVRLLDSPQTLAAEEGSLYRAKQAATLEMPFRCPTSYKTIALPSLEDHGWTVYLLPQGDDKDLISIGGHLRAEVSRDGTEVESIGALTAGCQSAPADAVASGDLVDGFWIMHTRSPVPHEVHVYLSLIHDLPLFIGTWNGVWLVEDGVVEFAYSWEERPR